MKQLNNCTIMVVDDSKINIDIMVELLENDYEIMVARGGKTALENMRSEPPDLLLLDIMMPEMDGYEVCRQMKNDPDLRDITVIFVTAMGDNIDEQKGLVLGAVDYIIKPYNPDIVKVRVKNHLELILAREQLKSHNVILEKKIEERTAELTLVQDMTIECLATLTDTRDPETGNHIIRTKNYVQALIEKLEGQSSCCRNVDAKRLKLIIKSTPLHDIGKVGIPDHILLKPGRLTASEFDIIKKHTIYGWQALRRTEKKLNQCTFLNIAANLAYTHHEKWDGSGYPRGLKGEAIPLSGRLMAIADVYDALTIPK